MDNWNGIISLLFACIEFILIVNLLILADKNRINKTAIIIAALLFVYQFLEFLMCYGGIESPILPYIAFVDISYLPPLGLYYTLLFCGYRINKSVLLIFLPAIFFTIFYAISIEKFIVVSCTVLYALYNYPLGTVYGFFYYLPIIATIILLLRQSIKKDDEKKSLLAGVLLICYVIVSLPVITAFVLSAIDYKFLLSIIESIMCKFALVLAAGYGFVSIYGRVKKA